ncbi:MAG: hypothetical protein Q9159_005925 [Coniocarpon cinnabarinum]
MAAMDKRWVKEELRRQIEQVKKTEAQIDGDVMEVREVAEVEERECNQVRATPGPLQRVLHLAMVRKQWIPFIEAELQKRIELYRGREAKGRETLKELQDDYDAWLEEMSENAEVYSEDEEWYHEGKSDIYQFEILPPQRSRTCLERVKLNLGRATRNESQRQESED